MITSKLNLTTSDPAIPLEYYQVQLETLLLCSRGTIPGWRDFGTAIDSLDMNQPGGVNMIGIEIERQLAQFLPEIKLETIEAYAQDDGTVSLNLTIGWR